MTLEESMKDDEVAMMRFNEQLEINQTLTALYLLIEVGRWQCTQDEPHSILRSIGKPPRGRYQSGADSLCSCSATQPPDLLDKYDCEASLG